MARMDTVTRNKYKAIGKDDECHYCEARDVPLMNEYVPQPALLGKVSQPPVTFKTCKSCKNRIYYALRGDPYALETLDQRIALIRSAHAPAPKVSRISGGEHSGKLALSGALFDGDWVYFRLRKIPVEHFEMLQPIMACISHFGTSKITEDCIALYEASYEELRPSIEVLRLTLEEME